MLTEKERQEYRQLTQNTPEWLTARRGLVTASRCAAVITKIAKGTKYSAARYDYLMELVVEHLTNRVVERYVTPAMEWGIEQQPFAEAAYEMATGASLESIGLVIHPEMEYFAASPDMLLEDDGLVEVKCPTTRVHLEYLKAGLVPEEYIPQINAQLACMPERQYCDFVSFDPRVPFGMQLFVRRHYRDRERIAQLEQEVNKFSAELAYELAELAGVRPLGEKVTADSIASNSAEERKGVAL